jgi:hypothetical protein
MILVSLSLCTCFLPTQLYNNQTSLAHFSYSDLLNKHDSNITHHDWRTR